MKADNELGFATRAIHAGQEPDPASGATVPPISISLDFTQAAPGDHKGYEIRPLRQPDAAGARNLPGGARGRRARAGVRLGLAATNASSGACSSRATR
jgi:cystathionine beta-lyase/cystathionine gamma-synthase